MVLLMSITTIASASSMQPSAAPMLAAVLPLEFLCIPRTASRRTTCSACRGAA